MRWGKHGWPGQRRTTDDGRRTTDDGRRTLAAQYLLEDLENGWLEVGKFRTENGWVRKVISSNAQWYRDFCKEHPSNRKRQRWSNPRTMIKRGLTTKALKRFINGDRTTLYVQRLTPHIDSLAKRLRRKRA